MSQFVRFRYLFDRLTEVINSNLHISFDCSEKKSLFNICFDRNTPYQKCLEQFAIKCTSNRLLIKNNNHKYIYLTIQCIIDNPDLIKILDQHDHFIVLKEGQSLINIHNPKSPSVQTVKLNLDCVYRDLLNNIDKTEIESFFSHTNLITDHGVQEAKVAKVSVHHSPPPLPQTQTQTSKKNSKWFFF